MQTFSFADSKLGYLTAAKGALVVRVKSYRSTVHPGPGTVTPYKTPAGDNDVKSTCFNHIADETGNFTLVQRRSHSDRIHFINAIFSVDLQALF